MTYFLVKVKSVKMFLSPSVVLLVIVLTGVPSFARAGKNWIIFVFLGLFS